MDRVEIRTLTNAPSGLRPGAGVPPHTRIGRSEIAGAIRSKIERGQLHSTTRHGLPPGGILRIDIALELSNPLTEITGAMSDMATQLRNYPAMRRIEFSVPGFQRPGGGSQRVTYIFERQTNGSFLQVQ
jgi:hypothetical protein